MSFPFTIRTAGIRTAAICVLVVIWSANASANAACKPAKPGGNVDDYRDSRAAKHMFLVESAHFTPEVRREALRGTGRNGRTTRHTYLGLDYLLRHFPNDPRGLRLMGIYTHRVKQNKEAWAQITGLARYQPVQCYFDAARRFAPDDHNVINAYGIYLNITGAHKEAIEAFESLTERVPNSAAAHYNLALSYYAANRYEDSVRSAHRAYKLGYKKQNLKVLLKRKGAWK